MQIVLWITSVALLSTTTTTNWWISWIVSFFALVLVVAMRTFDPSYYVLSRSNNKELTPNPTAESSQQPYE
jgi:hypothetical protein